MDIFTGAAAAVGGALLENAWEDHDESERQEGFDQGYDNGYDQGFDNGTFAFSISKMRSTQCSSSLSSLGADYADNDYGGDF